MIEKSYPGLFFACSAGIVGVMFRKNMALQKLSIIDYKRWSEAGVFEGIFEALAGGNADFLTLMIDATHVKTHRIAANGVKKTLVTDVQ